MFKYEGENSRYIGSLWVREEVGKQAENEILQALAIYEILIECECIRNKNRQLSELLNILSRYVGRGQEPPFLSLTDPGKDSLQLLQIEEPWG